MADKREVAGELPQAETLKGLGLLLEILTGFGIFLGLGLLWILEMVRNGVFRLLDRANIKPRVRRASPFPPGPARKRSLAEAER